MCKISGGPDDYPKVLRYICPWSSLSRALKGVDVVVAPLWWQFCLFLDCLSLQKQLLHTKQTVHMRASLTGRRPEALAQLWPETLVLWYWGLSAVSGPAPGRYPEQVPCSHPAQIHPESGGERLNGCIWTLLGVQWFTCVNSAARMATFGILL